MDSKTISYRDEVRPADVENVRRVIESSAFFSDEEVEIAVELVQERLAKGIKSGYHFLFAEQGGNVVGYTCYGPIAGTKLSYDLYWIAVDNHLRGGGVGKELLAATEQEIARQGGRRIYVETSSRGKYEPTRAFYRKRGYQQEAFLEDFYSPGDGKVIYVKEVNPAA